MAARCKAPTTIDRNGGDCADPTCRAHQHNEDGPTQPASCTATSEIRVGNQVQQTAHCWRPLPHHEHWAQILDSDDNPITHRWRTS